jgi:hypothetical protein
MLHLSSLKNPSNLHEILQPSIYSSAAKRVDIKTKAVKSRPRMTILQRQAAAQSCV